MTIAQLLRNPERYIGKVVWLECRLTFKGGAIYLTDTEHDWFESWVRLLHPPTPKDTKTCFSNLQSKNRVEQLLADLDFSKFSLTREQAHTYIIQFLATKLPEDLSPLVEAGLADQVAQLLPYRLTSSFEGLHWSISEAMHGAHQMRGVVAGTFEIVSDTYVIDHVTYVKIEHQEFDCIIEPEPIVDLTPYLPTSTPVLSVSEVLANLPMLRGKQIAIQGIFAFQARPSPATLIVPTVAHLSLVEPLAQGIRLEAREFERDFSNLFDGDVPEGGVAFLDGKMTYSKTIVYAPVVKAILVGELKVSDSDNIPILHQLSNAIVLRGKQLVYQWQFNK